jgi:hypothetical protein
MRIMTEAALELLRKSFLASSTTCLSAVPKDSFWTYAAVLLKQD